MALGCSSNSVLHLLAIANEAGIPLDMNIFNEMSAKTPNLCHLAPAGRTYIQELNEAGGIYAVMNELSKKNLIELDTITATGKKIEERLFKETQRDVSLKYVAIPNSESFIVTGRGELHLSVLIENMRREGHPYAP